MWEHNVDAIAEAGWTVIAPDIRGCGRGPSWEDSDISLRTCAKDVVAILDRLGIQQAVVGGCSLGGYITMELMRYAPERVAAAMFFDTKASADTDEQRANRVRVAESVTASETTEAFWRAMLPNVVGSTTHASRPDIVAEVETMMRDSRPEGVAALQTAMASRFDSHEIIGKFRGPVLSVRGTEDGIASAADHAAIMAAAQDGVHVDIAGAGHLAPLEDATAANAAILNFLEQVQKTSC